MMGVDQCLLPVGGLDREEALGPLGLWNLGLHLKTFTRGTPQMYILPHSRLHLGYKKKPQGFPGGPLAKRTSAGGPGSTPAQRTRSHMRQLRVHVAQLKTPPGAAKTWCSQANQ